MTELFLNRAYATLASGIDASTTTLPLTTGHGARFGTIPNGSKVRIVFLNASLNVSEVAYITAISGDTATIVRGQDGTSGASHLAGDRIEARIGKSTMDSLAQYADLAATGGAALIGNTPAGNLAATTVQAAINELDTEKAKLAGDAAQSFACSSLSINGVANQGFAAGVRMAFNLAAAPTGWTRVTKALDGTTDLDGSTMRIMGTGTPAQGGSVAFTTAFASQAVSGTVAGHVLTIAEMPSHTHSTTGGNGTSGTGANCGNNLTQYNFSTVPSFVATATGGDGSHSHGFTGTAINLAVKYNDFMICSKAA